MDPQETKKGFIIKFNRNINAKAIGATIRVILHPNPLVWKLVVYWKVKKSIASASDQWSLYQDDSRKVKSHVK